MLVRRFEGIKLDTSTIFSEAFGTRFSPDWPTAAAELVLLVLLVLGVLLLFAGRKCIARLR